MATVMMAAIPIPTTINNQNGVSAVSSIPIVYFLIVAHVFLLSEFPPNFDGFMKRTDNASNRSCSAIPIITNVFLFARFDLETAQMINVPISEATIVITGKNELVIEPLNASPLKMNM